MGKPVVKRGRKALETLNKVSPVAIQTAKKVRGSCFATGLFSLLQQEKIYKHHLKETDQIKTLISINNQNKNKVGEISIYLKDDKIGSLDIYKNKQKKKETFLQKIKNLFIR